MKIAERNNLEQRLERSANAQYKARQERARFNDKSVAIDEDDLDNEIIAHAFYLIRAR
jgi:hypothetical protein